MFVSTRQTTYGDVPTWLFHPTPAAPSRAHFGPFTLDVARDAPIAEGRFPLVVIAHGAGGGPLLHRGLATHLAAHGFVVALPQHTSIELEQMLIDRPRAIRRVIDGVVVELPVDRVGILGHSIGGYAGLALAGGRPSTRDGRPIEIEPDPRIASLVLLAPTAAFFAGPGSLAAVSVPMLIVCGEEDEATPPWHGHLVRYGVRDRSNVELRVVDGAGHYSFLAPFPAAMQRPDFAPANDPPGFDRARFHDTLAPAVGAFFERTLR